MFSTLAKKVVGTRNDRILKRLRKRTADVQRHAERVAGWSDDELRACTDAFRERLGAGEALDDLHAGGLRRRGARPARARWA
ncbi:MAG: hypothetical protein U5K43_11350 [Halofilum sp. (in: g-proteobacteria)]|nr:hypothetical protein [Halofilum sp. (in: g-proteobacteria)]